MIRTIFAQETKAEAFVRWAKVADALRERHDKLGAPMDAAREDVLTCTDYPKEHRAQTASTNPLERVNKEIKRHADAVGIFPNDAAVIRLIGALMLEQSDEWAVSRRCFSLESLARRQPSTPAARRGSLIVPRTSPRTSAPTPCAGARPGAVASRAVVRRAGGGGRRRGGRRWGRGDRVATPT